MPIPLDPHQSATDSDDATRVREIKVSGRHTRVNAVLFIDHASKTLAFRMRELKTEKGHEFESKFHWPVQSQGIRHACIKPWSQQFNCKVERSHRTGEEELHLFLTYKDGADLEETCSLGAVL